MSWTFNHLFCFAFSSPFLLPLCCFLFIPTDIPQMDIRPCPPGDIFHYYAVTVLIHRPISLLINGHAAQQAHTNKTDTNL